MEPAYDNNNTITMDDVHIKSLFKQAIVELIHERRDVFIDFFADAEDITMKTAIEEGVETEIVSREVVFDILEGTATPKVIS